MGFIENLRQWTSEQADKLTGQENVYHRSTGKTQKEYENDINTYKALENGVLADALFTSAGLGAGLGAEVLGANPVLGAMVGARRGGMLAPGAAALLGGLTGGSFGGGFAGGEKRWDNKENGGTDFKKTSEPVEQKDTEEPVKEEVVEEKVETPKYDVDEMAGEFILGAWGNGQDRIDNMINAGYSLDDYNTIQQRVNEAYESGRDLHEWTNKANEKLHYW